MEFVGDGNNWSSSMSERDDTEPSLSSAGKVEHFDELEDDVEILERRDAREGGSSPRLVPSECCFPIPEILSMSGLIKALKRPWFLIGGVRFEIKERGVSSVVPD